MKNMTLQRFAVDSKTIKSSDLARARSIDFTEQFTAGIDSLMTMLGITRKIEKQAGAPLYAYKVTGTLESGTVAEGEVIPLSKYATTYTQIGTAILKKWRKTTTAEAISDKGYDQAVNDTDAKMLRDVQAGIKTQLTTFLGTGTGTATGVGLQATLADVWGKLQIAWADTNIQSVYLINPLDVSKYLGSAQVTVQNAFGLKYIEDFLGLGTVILDGGVPQGKVYGTAIENLVLYYVNVTGSDLAKAFPDLESDETGLIGVANIPVYNSASIDTVVLSGVGLFAEQLAGVVVGTITAAA